MASASEVSPALRPMCPAHPVRVAVATCARCGQFVCVPCVSGGGLCRACVRHNLAAVPSSEARARRTVLFLRLSAGVGVVSLLVYLWGVLAPGVSDTLEFLEILLAIPGVLILPVTPVLYLMWLHRVVRQLNAWGREVGATPRWAVGCWFVPFVNLVKPFRVVRSIVEEVGGEPLAASLQLGLWWGLFVLSRMVGRVHGRLALSAPPLVAYGVGIAWSVLTIAAAFFCVRIVREVQARLEARRGGL
jgi:uncharacterized protein DUF4328